MTTNQFPSFPQSFFERPLNLLDNSSMAMKLKRKDLEEVNNDFSDFSLSAPALKIRRLDADLPPIIEEEDVEISLRYEQPMQENVVPNLMNQNFSPLKIEELPMVPENEEKAIVLFKPVNNLLLYSPGNYSVDPNLISTFKNQALQLNASISDDDEYVRSGDNPEGNTCRAVIPWVPSQQLDKTFILSSQTEVSEAMDAEEMEAATMEIEDAGSNDGQHAMEYGNYLQTSEGLHHQWQQQHCLIPQPPQNTTTPIVWYR